MYTNVVKCIFEIYIGFKELPRQWEVVGPRFKRGDKPSEGNPKFRALFPSRHTASSRSKNERLKRWAQFSSFSQKEKGKEKFEFKASQVRGALHFQWGSEKV